MATKKDLVEAYSFSRRRLVTAFLSGAPGGREVEPSRPGRTVVGGLALAVLLIAGAAIASVLASRTEEDWNKVGLVVSREEAAPYVILDDSEDPTLIPVINITSAQLILGVERAEPTYVSQDVIEDQTPGDPIGIAGAPQTLPRPKQFIESGWTSCTDTGIGITTAISAEPMASISQDLGTVVKSGDAYYVLATSSDDDDHQRTYRYPVPVPRNPANDPADGLLLALGIEDVRSEATEVPLDWLNLFPEGGVLGADSFDFEDGGKLLNEEGYPSEARVGDYIEDGNGPALVLTREGPSALSDFALAVLKNTLFTKRKELPNPVEMERPSAVATERTYTDALWPDDLLQQATRRTLRATGRHDRRRAAGAAGRGAARRCRTRPDRPGGPEDGRDRPRTRCVRPDRGLGRHAKEVTPTSSTRAARPTSLEGPNTLEKLELRRRRRAGDHGLLAQALPQGRRALDRCRAVPAGPARGGPGDPGHVPRAAVVSRRRADLCRAGRVRPARGRARAGVRRHRGGLHRGHHADPVRQPGRDGPGQPAAAGDGRRPGGGPPGRAGQAAGRGRRGGRARLRGRAVDRDPAGRPARRPARRRRRSYYHGTAVAGLIAGPPRADGSAVGIAPAAQILDVQVYDDPVDEADRRRPRRSRSRTSATASTR